MNLNIPSIKFASQINNIKYNNISNISFGSIQDKVTLSDDALKKKEITKNLTLSGIKEDKAREFVQKYYGTPEYKNLISGDTEQNTGENRPAHNVDINKNLTPEEAIVYLGYDMDDYYAEHNNSKFSDMRKTTANAEDEKIGKIKFSPLALASKMSGGYSIELAGAILKGKINNLDSRRVNSYYSESRYAENKEFDVKSKEWFMQQIADKSALLDKMTVEENIRQIRPLTKKEAVYLLDGGIAADASTVNSYIELSEKYGHSVETLALNSDLYDALV